VIFTTTKLLGAYIIDLDKRSDDRGFFARAWCQKEFEAHHLTARSIQCNLSFSPKKGTLRGMHYQVAPYEEAKLVRCTQGALYDVIIDLRSSSSTYLQWIGVELTAENRRMLFVPEGFAHGFQTLMDNTEAFYQVSQFYHPEAERGVRWNDPVFAIEWPDVCQRSMSVKDMHWPDFAPQLTNQKYQPTPTLP
jgi:dTDP-4-dehydrorhamnose 3,5-epimerase